MNVEMNVEKINRLSGQHEDLRKFFGVCTRSGSAPRLTIESQYSQVLLGGSSTGLVLCGLRKILIEQMGKIKDQIIEETTASKNSRSTCVVR